MSIFSERLKLLREKAGLTQKEVASMLDMTQSSYSKYEYGTREPNIENILRLSKIFNVTTDFLLGNLQNVMSETVTIPLLQKVVDGEFMYDPEGSLPFPKEFIEDKDAFLYQATDSSMTLFDIDINDFVVIERTADITSTEIILALVNEQLIIRQATITNDSVIFSAGNSMYPPTVHTLDEIEVIGKVIGIFRNIE